MCRGPCGGEWWQGTTVRLSVESLFTPHVCGKVAIVSHHELSRVMCVIMCMVRQWIVVG